MRAALAPSNQTIALREDAVRRTEGFQRTLCLSAALKEYGRRGSQLQHVWLLDAMKEAFSSETWTNISIPLTCDCFAKMSHPRIHPKTRALVDATERLDGFDLYRARLAFVFVVKV